MLKVISFTICPFVQRITAMLEAKNIPHEVEFISLSNKPQWFLDISPNAQVPVLITEKGTALFESDAIAEYLEEAYPTLQTDLTAEQKAKNRAWSYLGSKHYLAQCSSQRSKDLETLIERTEELAKSFSKVEGVLGEYRFFNSDDLSMVDLAWLPILHRTRIVFEKTGYDFLKDFPKVKAWQNSLKETGLFERSVSEDFIEKFGDFYLSGDTYLARLKDDAKARPTNSSQVAKSKSRDSVTV